MSDTRLEVVGRLGKSLDDALLDALNSMSADERALMCDKVRDALTDMPMFRIVDGRAERA